ncbi:MAG: hypothetical protein JSR82_14765 [Verrucomicrobia bacterium]|nr:hypothetical protein [Verrucomicrobiota bacterium]
MKTIVVVLDTSYLTELYRCPEYFHSAFSAAARQRLASHQAAGASFYLPLPCLFELGSKIAHGKDASERMRLARQLRRDVDLSFTARPIWKITPAGKPEDVLPPLLETFESSIHEKIGLVDTFVAAEAHRLKIERANFKPVVHIWTKDTALKAREPDPEPDPLITEA